ncbi:hypothetical protein [Algoriphagus boritolerans]|uniref:hypothetical protein n=1 Tax=Algoriphagus boritolerans TaxID=308111 RepID=UPI000A49CFAE
MANSERVFLDGKQLQRGFNADYVIDYNQAEITFTPKVLITQYSRVRVDFEFAERNYSRSILGANHLQTNGKVDFYVNHYQEKDNRNRPLFTEFTQAEQALLANVGDRIENAVIPRIDSVAYDPTRILYEKVTELDDFGNLQIYFRYSTDPELAHFALSFSQVGPNQGNYKRSSQLSNGTVFEYVPPVSGQPQGDYSILTQLPAPDSKQMTTAGTRVKLGEYEKVYTEVALSSVDKNLFSTIDEEDNQGLGWKVGLQSENRELGIFKGYKFKGLAEFEYNSTNFNFIDRFRYIEFDRDWGVTQEILEMPAAERFFSYSNRLGKRYQKHLQLQALPEKSGKCPQWFTAHGQLDYSIGKAIFGTTGVFFTLNSELDTLNSSWTRYLGNVSFQSKILVPGYQFSLDRNALKKTESDSVLSTAMNFKEHLIYLRSNDSLRYSFLVDAAWREDKSPVFGRLVDDTRAFTSNFTFQKQWTSTVSAAPLPIGSWNICSVTYQRNLQ